jgi:glycosyltransferase involved in cell wall biosynthesis
MEIIHVVLGKANPQRMNGVNKVVYQLATRQAAAGLQVELWGITRQQDHNYPARNFKTRLFRAYTNKFQLDSGFKLALNSIGANAVFHLHGGFNPIFYSISTALSKRNIPFVFTPHGAFNTIAMERSNVVKKIYIHFFERKLLQRAGVVHCLGKSETEGLRTILQHPATHLVPYGFEPEWSGKHIPDYHRFIIGFCGRLDIYTKGIDVLLKAFAMVKKIHPHAELWLIGDGDDRNQIEREVLNNQLKGVTLWGPKFGVEKTDLLKQVHLFAHPSRNEGLPSSVLEAASMGIPCVITEATNLGNSVRTHACGEVINEAEAGDLFAAISRAYSKIRMEGWKKYSEAAKQMVQEDYNWENVLVKFDEMYRTLC